jgi:O-antigen ligase
LTGSRGAAISFAIGLVFIVFTSWRYVEKSLLIAVIIISFVAYVSIHFITEDTKYNISHRLSALELRESGGELHIGSFFNPRAEAWHPAWQVIKTAPIIGTGIGTYYIVSSPYKIVGDNDAGYFVHNDFLQFWLELGLVGLSLMLLLMSAVSMQFVLLLRNIRLNPTRPNSSQNCKKSLCTKYPESTLSTFL